MGIRPLYLEVHAEPADNRVSAQVKMVEDLGSYKIVTLRLAGKTLKASLSEDQPVPERQAWLSFPQQWTRLFADGWLIK